MYDRLKETIESIALIDDHGHPGFAMYFSNLPEKQRIPFAVDGYKSPAESSAGFPYLRELHAKAYEEFYGFTREAMADPAQTEQLKARYEEKRQTIDKWIDELLDKSGVDILMANIALPDALKNNRRIRFVPSVDPLVFPFDNSFLKKRVLSDYFLGYFEYELARLKQENGYEATGFSGYLAFVDTVLAAYYQQKNIPAFKFVIAYARDTNFVKVAESEGENLYEAAKQGDEAAYVRLQDLLVWHIMRWIVRHDMAVQFHYAITDNYVNYFDPLNLANMLADEELKQAKIVILHGGYPRFQNAEVLALGGLTPNQVCIDISGRIMFANHPKIIAKMLRSWLEKPLLWDKILYGSDVLWGERYVYTCARTGRDAVYFALSSMIDDDIIDEATAISIAKKILRENALRLYRLD